jgi:hypothetical protein
MCSPGDATATYTRYLVLSIEGGSPTGFAGRPAFPCTFTDCPMLVVPRIVGPKPVILGSTGPEQEARSAVRELPSSGHRARPSVAGWLPAYGMRTSRISTEDIVNDPPIEHSPRWAALSSAGIGCFSPVRESSSGGDYGYCVTEQCRPPGAPSHSVSSRCRRKRRFQDRVGA